MESLLVSVRIHPSRSTTYRHYSLVSPPYLRVFYLGQQLTNTPGRIVLYERYRTPSIPDQPVEYPEPGIPSTTLKVIIGTTTAVALPVSLAFLWFNKHPKFDEDTPQGMHNYILVYIFGLSGWNLILIPSNLAFVLVQFLYQVWTVRELKSRGAISLAYLWMQSAAFILLALAQIIRSWSRIEWPDVSISDPVGRLVEKFMVFYASINTHLAYFLIGLGFLVLAIIYSVEGVPEVTGRIRLP